MRLVRDDVNFPEKLRNAVVAVGNFDGLHHGHRLVIGKALALAHDRNAPCAVLTFYPHPRQYFKPALPCLQIYTLRTKLLLLRNIGVDVVFLQRFNADFARLNPEEFIRHVLLERLHVQHVVTGENFVFGRARAGDTAMLAASAAAHGFGYTAVNIHHDPAGNACSSTHIRKLLHIGNVADASRLLSRPYSISGRVIHGDRRGRSLGFPTANIRLGKRFSPAYGVYAVRAHLPQGEKIPGVANLGVRPTFGGNTELLEVHLFNFNADLYGARIEVEPVKFLRPEKKFSGLQELKQQIQEDCSNARSVL